MGHLYVLLLTAELAISFVMLSSAVHAGCSSKGSFNFAKKSVTRAEGIVSQLHDMQGQGRGVAQNVGVDIDSSSTGDKSKSYAGHGRSAYGYGINPAPFTVPTNYGYDYGYGYGYGNWAFGLPLLSLPPLVGSSFLHGHGKAPRPSTPLGVQGGGILKKNPQGAFVQGRGYARSHVNGRSSAGGRGGKNLTKEALDADLEEWRLKDKRFAGHSLDAELDDYWSKKDTTPDSEAETGK